MAAGIDVWPLVPLGGDFNDDLRQFGAVALRGQLLTQMAPNDIALLDVA